MSIDSKIQVGVRGMLRAIDAPPVPMASIHRRMQARTFAGPLRSPHRRIPVTAAAGVAAVLLCGLPLISPALVQSLEARYRAAVQALGGIAPPAPPKSELAQLKSETAKTLADAQSRVSFTIVAPSGLPSDAVRSEIMTTPTGIFDKHTQTWSKGPVEVAFSYRRSGGRTFVLLADRYDATAQKPPKYLFTPLGIGRDGKPIIAKHENFAWRNGDQVMQAAEGPELSVPEIRNIEHAMGGVWVPERNLHAPDTSPTNTLRVITRP